MRMGLPSTHLGAVHCVEGQIHILTNIKTQKFLVVSHKIQSGKYCGYECEIMNASVA